MYQKNSEAQFFYHFMIKMSYHPTSRLKKSATVQAFVMLFFFWPFPCSVICAMIKQTSFLPCLLYIDPPNVLVQHHLQSVNKKDNSDGLWMTQAIIKKRKKVFICSLTGQKFNFWHFINEDKDTQQIQNKLAAQSLFLVKNLNNITPDNVPFEISTRSIAQQFPIGLFPFSFWCPVNSNK